MSNGEEKRSGAFHGLPKATGPGVDEVSDLYSQINDLKKRASEIDKKFDSAEQRNDRATTFVMTVVGAIGLATFLALILIALDYWKYNEDRFEKNRAQIQLLEERFLQKYYTREQIDPYKLKSESTYDVINCIRMKGFFSMNCL